MNGPLVRECICTNLSPAARSCDGRAHKFGLFLGFGTYSMSKETGSLRTALTDFDTLSSSAIFILRHARVGKMTVGRH